jgi:hypothetical protein
MQKLATLKRMKHHSQNLDEEYCNIEEYAS